MCALPPQVFAHLALLMDDLLFETGLRRLRFTDQSHVVFYSAQDGGSKEWLSPKQLQEILRVNIDVGCDSLFYRQIVALVELMDIE